MLKRLTLLVTAAGFFAAGGLAASVTVSGASERAVTAAIRSACKGASGGTVTFPKGAYFVASTIRVPAHCALLAASPGQAVLKANQSQIFEIEGDGVTIDGLTLDGGWVSFGHANSYSNFVFTNNVIQNLWSGGVNGGPTALNGPGLIHSTISKNRFFNLWANGPPGYPNVPPPDNAGNCPGVDCWGSAGITLSGLDQVTISDNTFDEIAGDGMHLDWESFTGYQFGRVTSGNVVAYNTFTRVRRMPIEVQSQPSGNCPGKCDYSTTNTIGLEVKGNFAHDFAFPFFDTWGASLVPDGAVNPRYINNTFIANPGNQNGYASCMESSSRNGLSQGNVCVSVPGAPKFFNAGIAQGGGSNPSFTSTYQNNIFCGNYRTTLFEQEPSNPNPNASRMIDQYNYKNADSCPAGANLTASAISIAFSSPNNRSFAAGASGAWSLAVVSNLSIKYVQFFLDGSTTAMVTQEIQDVNTNFAKDRKWLYHATINTANLAKGSHTILAVANDVSGAKQTASQTFSIH